MSLNQRIILSATFVLIVFVTLTAAALNRAFINSTESALKDKLNSQLYALMAVAELDEQGISMPSNELDTLLGLPSSGVYAFISDYTGNIIWQSTSALGAKPPQPIVLGSGQYSFNKTDIENIEYYSLAYGVNWTLEKESVALTFNISTDLQSFNQQIDHYRTTLWLWLVAMAVFLLISQAIILRWGLLPLRKVATELNLIETGKQDSIEHHYPREIERLTKNINQLLMQERKQKKRYRNALGDLAHSLKTPLAVLQSSLGTKNNSEEIVQQQISRMNSIVEYQLQRAATSGPITIGKSVSVNLILNRINDSLQKVYRDKNISVEMLIKDEISFQGDEGDLMELLGNLLDNAFKWADKTIIVEVTKIDNKLKIRIVDDGPGIEQDNIKELLQRGVRADQAVAGHGIGLSIVRNIVNAYEGTLSIKKSSLNGAEIIITL